MYFGMRGEDSSAGSEVETSPSNSSDSQSLYQEPAPIPAHTSANDADSCPEVDEDDHEPGSPMPNIGSVSDLISNGVSALSHVQKRTLVILNSGPMPTRTYRRFNLMASSTPPL